MVGGVGALGDALYGELQSPAHPGQRGGIQRVPLPAQGRGDVLLAGAQGSPLPRADRHHSVEKASVPDQDLPLDGKAVLSQGATQVLL